MVFLGANCFLRHIQHSTIKASVFQIHNIEPINDFHFQRHSITPDVQIDTIIITTRSIEIYCILIDDKIQIHLLLK